MNARLLIIVFAFSFLSCKEDESFMFDESLLTNTEWGQPEIVETGHGSQTNNMSAPTIFYKNGQMTIGQSYHDTWYTRGKRQLILEMQREMWLVLALQEDLLIVEKYTLPEQQFIAKCRYRPFR